MGRVSVTTLRELSVADVALECHISESTLRMWERRYKFPNPERTRAGCRRYSERDVRQIREVLRLRQQGLSLPAAIGRVVQAPPPGRRLPLSAQLRAEGAYGPIAMSEEAFERLAAAFADECASQGDADVVLLGLRRQARMGVATPRWAELAHTSRLAVAFGDFPNTRTAPAGWHEIALPHRDPLGHDRFLVVDTPGFSAALVAWERPRAPTEPPVYEVSWTLSPEVVRNALTFALTGAAQHLPDPLAGALDELEARPLPATQPDTCQGLVNRLIGYLGELYANARASVAAWIPWGELPSPELVQAVQVAA